MEHKDILFYNIFSGAFVKRAKLRGSFRKSACIRWDGKQNYRSRIWNFVWYVHFNFLVPSLFMYCWPWQIDVRLCTGEPVFLFWLLVWDCTNHSDYCCILTVYNSKFTPRSFLWVCKRVCDVKVARHRQFWHSIHRYLHVQYITSWPCASAQQRLYLYLYMDNLNRFLTFCWPCILV